MTLKNTDPKVSIFGLELNSEKWNYQFSERVLWGSFLIFAGIIFFLNTLDLLPWAIWTELLRFWPLLLILSGLQILLGGKVIARWVMTFITLVTFGLVLLSVLDQAFPELIAQMPPFIQQTVNLLKDMVNQ